MLEMQHHERYEIAVTYQDEERAEKVPCLSGIVTETVRKCKQSYHGVHWMQNESQRDLFQDVSVMMDVKKEHS